MKRMGVLIFLGLLWTLSVTPAMAYKWTVRVPNDGTVPLSHVQIFCNGLRITDNSGWVDVARGHSYTWHAADKEPLTFISGRSPSGLETFMSRTCSGTDFQGMHSSTECRNDVKLKVCPKVSDPAPYFNSNYGFCPD